MNGSVYAVLINSADRPVPNDRVEGVLNGAKNWLRYSRDIYFVRTELDASAWYRRVRAVLHPDDLVMVIEANENNRMGWVTQLAREWFENASVALPFGE